MLVTFWILTTPSILGNLFPFQIQFLSPLRNLLLQFVTYRDFAEATVHLFSFIASAFALLFSLNFFSIFILFAKMTPVGYNRMPYDELFNALNLPPPVSPSPFTVAILSLSQMVLFLKGVSCCFNSMFSTLLSLFHLWFWSFCKVYVTPNDGWAQHSPVYTRLCWFINLIQL